MEKNKKKDDLKEGTQAADTLAPNSRPASKLEMMANVMSLMKGASNGDMLKFFELAMSQLGTEAETISNDAAARNAATIVAKGAVAEDIAVVFGDDENLSEEFKEKVTTLFEAAIETRLSVEVARLEEEFAVKLDEQVETVTEKLVETVDTFMNFTAEQWLKENEVALDSSIKTELTESFLKDLGTLCKNYNFDLPDSDISLVEELTVKVEELENKLNESEKLNVQLHETASTLEREVIIAEATIGLNAFQADKMRQLSESIDFDGDADKYQKKLNIIRENYFEKKKSVDSGILSEEIAYNNGEEEEKKFTSPGVKAAYNLISRTAKR